jgi:hypothetical protein
MEYLFSLIFTIVKVLLQASAYATLLLILAKMYAKFSPNSKVAQLASNGRRFRRLSGLIVLLGLFFIANTPWGDHGLGDYARIPLGNGEIIEQINGMEAYFQAEAPLKLSTDQPFIDSFAVAGDVLCGKASDKSFFTYDLATKQQRIFADSQEYTAYANEHALPAITDFKSFDKHYHDYWGGWRFWLLA